MYHTPKKLPFWLVALSLLVVAYAVLPSGKEGQYSTVRNSIVPKAVSLSNVTEVDPVIVGAGDIAKCSSESGEEATAALLDSIPGTVITLGDNAYEDGTPAEFVDCYDPTWGRHKARTRPSVGNHEYQTAGATGYYDYFGAAAGDPTKGYYSYVLDTWLIIVINSNCSAIGGVGVRKMVVTWPTPFLFATSVGEASMPVSGHEQGE